MNGAVAASVSLFMRRSSVTAPGLTGIVGGRPKVSPVFKLFSFLYPKSSLKVSTGNSQVTHKMLFMAGL